MKTAPGEGGYVAMALVLEEPSGVSSHWCKSLSCSRCLLDQEWFAAVTPLRYFPSVGFVSLVQRCCGPGHFVDQPLVRMLADQAA